MGKDSVSDANMILDAAGMDKQTILANMYALRAGLSVVAVNSDKIDKQLGKAKTKAKDDEKAAREAKKRAVKSVSDQRGEIKRLNDELDKRKQLKKKAVSDGAKNAGWQVVNILMSLVFFALGLACLASLAYFVTFWIMTAGAFGDPPTNGFILKLYSWTFKYIAGKDPESWFMWTMIGSTAASVGAAVLGIWLLRHAFVGGGYSSKDSSSESSEKLPKPKKIKKKIADLSDSAGALEACLPAYDADIDRAIKDGKELVAKTCVSLEPLSTSTMALYKALQATFTPFLDERDWDNLDLLTYYIETGRADSVKESLQLLDRQKQTEQIVAAVKEAAGAICRTVNKGLNRLQNDMRKCFTVLSDQISEVGNMVYSVGSRVSSVESAVASQSAQLSEMASVASLNSALAARANDNSAELISCARTCANNSNYIADQVRQAQIGGRI